MSGGSSPRRSGRKSERSQAASHNSSNHAVPANPLQAFRDVCFAFGVPALAAALGYREGTLYNKADADAESHHQPTLRDVINVTRATGDTRILESLDRLFDRAGFEMPPAQACSDEHLLELLCGVNVENGQLHAAVKKALEDKRFTREEHHNIRGEAFDLVSQVMAFLARLEGLIDE